MHVKKGDNVIVIAGKEKGKKGTISRVLPATGKVIVEGLNIAKRHTRPRKAGEKGGIVEMAMPLDASNVKLAEKKAKAEKKPVAKKTVKKEKKAE